MMRTVDLLYTCHNRKEFVSASLQNLLDNTNWELVRSCIVCMDNCTENLTQDCMSKLKLPPSFPYKNLRFLITSHGSIVEIMKNWIVRAAEAPLLAKIDSDTMVPPGWLNECVETAEQYPRVDLLGIEAYGDLTRNTLLSTAMRPARGIRITDHIGGIGVFRRRVFTPQTLDLLQPRGTFHGFTEWQWSQPWIVKAWLDPALPVFLLDHLPFEPWKTLTDEYVAKGWMRRTWGHYEVMAQGNLWDWWKK